MTKTKLVWRLERRPTAQEVIDLRKAGLINDEEAKQILFSSETEEDRDKKSLESEIKFLRETIERLSSDRNRVIEVIREVKVPYYQQPWYRPYEVWCVNNTSNITGGLSNTISSGPGTISFSNISTF